jgi:excisionase family DNA binding protein
MSAPPVIVARGAMSINEFTQWASICRTKVYEEIGAGRLRIHKVGRRTLISYVDAERWLATHAVNAPVGTDDLNRKKNQISSR